MAKVNIYDIHYKAGERDWRYAGDIDATTAASAVKKFKRDGSNRWAFEGKKLRAKRRNPLAPATKTNKRGARAARKTHRTAKKLLKSGRKKMEAWVRSGGKRNAAKKNPVRIGATMAGKSTGWVKSKATRVRRTKSGFVVDVKR